MDTFELRGAAFAIRANIDFLRMKRRQSPEAGMGIDDPSFEQLKIASQRVIRSLERHMKRANRALQQAVSNQQYQSLMAAWTDHLRWMRFHIAYFKPPHRTIRGRRIRQQKALDELMRMAERGLRNEGYQPPEGKELRRIMRLYARSARRGREGFRSVPYLLKYSKDFNNTWYLARFVLQRLTLQETPPS